MRAHADRCRADGLTTALVPTMGGLHAGHLALVEEARRLANHVTVSVFVNPTQFASDEDLERYPRDLDADVDKIGTIGGVDVIFAPHMLYGDGSAAQRVWVDSGELTAHLCGPHRHGHFRGVATVVTKLFALCRPDIAVFGLKDAQQFFLIRKLSDDLLFGVQIVGVDTVRERDGLALSSRNVYLGAEERTQAVVLSRSVEAARRAILEGERSHEAVVAAMHRELERAALARVQYAEVVSTDTLAPLESIAPGQKVLAAVAVFFSATRLIDNAIVRAPQQEDSC